MQNVKIYKQNTKPDEIKLKHDRRPYKIVKENFQDNLSIVKDEFNEYKVVKIEIDTVIDDSKKEIQLEYMVPTGHFPHDPGLDKEQVQKYIAYYTAILEHIEKEEAEYGLKEK